MTPAATACLLLAALCPSLAPRCDAVKVRDRMAACRKVRRCLEVAAEVCALSRSEQRAKDARTRGSGDAAQGDEGGRR